jgi:hypothetical protein
MVEAYPQSGFPREADENTDVLTVSRSEAQKYEEYEKWYKNKDGLFTALGKFVGSVPGLSESRITLANKDVKVRSSVENLRNPVHRTVEFYATTLLSGAMEEMLKVAERGSEEDDSAETKDASGDGEEADGLKEAVEQILEWSTLDQRKQVAKRHLALYGQLFIKVVKPEMKDHCYLQLIKPEHVTDLDTDERDNVTYIRVDTPDVRRSEDGQTRKIWVTEIWRKSDGEKPGYALFGESERTTSASVPSEKRVAEKGKRVELGASPSGSGSGYRFDFVPFVCVNAADTGEKRPDPVYAHGLHLIAWTCREATRLSDLIFRFNKAFKVIGGMGNDAQNRPLPPPKPGNVRDLGQMHREQEQAAEHTVPFGGSRASLLSRENEDISIEGIAVVGLPGNAQMFDATPNINYEAARVWINDHIREVYEELPELLYYAIESRANQSNAALRTLIAGALSRAEEMQANLVTGLVKATKMALTVAQLANLKGFEAGKIGTYKDGGFDFSIEPPEILPLTEEEEQRAESGKLTNAQSLMAILGQLGVSAEDQQRVILTELGHENLIESAGEPAPASAGFAEGQPTSDELAASRQALAARLSGVQTPTGSG